MLLGNNRLVSKKRVAKNFKGFDIKNQGADRPEIHIDGEIVTYKWFEDDVSPSRHQLGSAYQ